MKPNIKNYLLKHYLKEIIREYVQNVTDKIIKELCILFSSGEMRDCIYWANKTHFDQEHLASLLKDDPTLKELYRRGCSNIDQKQKNNRNISKIEKRLRKKSFHSNLIDLAIYDFLKKRHLTVSAKNNLILEEFKKKKTSCRCRETGYGLCFHKHPNGLWIYPPTTK